MMALTIAVLVLVFSLAGLGVWIRSDVRASRDAILRAIQADSDTWLDRERQADAKRQAQAALWKTGEGRAVLRARLLKRLENANP